MKRLITIFCILFTIGLFAQEDQKKLVKQTIETFFDGFHKGDTTVMKSVMMDKMVLQTAFVNRDGKDILRNDGGPEKLLDAIVNRPDDQKWDERLTAFSIQVDGNMANAWVDYEFWLNDNFSHCGVNSFQLFRENGQWKIIYLIDTRRRQDCEAFKG